MASAQQDGRLRKARSLRIIGSFGLVGAAVFLLAAGPYPALGLALLGVGNLLAARSMERTGAVPTPIRAMIIIGGSGFVVAIAVTTVMMINTTP